MYTIQHLLAALENSLGKPLQLPRYKTQTIFFMIIRLALVFWLVAMIASSVVVSRPCLKGGQECNLQVITVVASALAE
jgi:hypothetical protein